MSSPASPEAEPLFETHVASLLSAATRTQESIQLISKYFAEHADRASDLVRIWSDTLTQCPSTGDLQLCLFYVANDVIQSHRRKHPQFVDLFESAFQSSLSVVAFSRPPAGTIKSISRLLDIWLDRQLFSLGVIAGFRTALNAAESAPHLPPSALASTDALLNVISSGAAGLAARSEADEGSYAAATAVDNALLTGAVLESVTDRSRAEEAYWRTTAALHTLGEAEAHLRTALDQRAALIAALTDLVHVHEEQQRLFADRLVSVKGKIAAASIVKQDAYTLCSSFPPMPIDVGASPPVARRASAGWRPTAEPSSSPGMMMTSAELFGEGDRGGRPHETRRYRPY